jgi:ribosomal protein S18 acetylase RimI-like enzyme
MPSDCSITSSISLFPPFSFVLPDGRSVAFRPLASSDLLSLKLLNDLIFPVKYSTDYYSSLLRADNFSIAGFVCSDQQEELICCASARIRDSPDNSSYSFSSILCQRTKELYLLTFGCSPAYRGCGLGFYLLTQFIRCSLLIYPSVELISLHMKADNWNALRLYERSGFMITGNLKDYYWIDGKFHDAIVMKRNFTQQEKNGEWNEQKDRKENLNKRKQTFCNIL